MNRRSRDWRTICSPRRRRESWSTRKRGLQRSCSIIWLSPWCGMYQSGSWDLDPSGSVSSTLDLCLLWYLHTHTFGNDIRKKRTSQSCADADKRKFHPGNYMLDIHGVVGWCPTCSLLSFPGCSPRALFELTHLCLLSPPKSGLQ